MASTSCPDDILQASLGKTRFVRLARLLICGGTTVLRELFDSIIPPGNLAFELTSPPVLTRLQQMKNRKLLTSPQWQILFPPSGTCVQSTSFDITLLFKLLRENVLCGLMPPGTGWDQLPNNGNISLPADMARIKYYRNAIAHGDEKMELKEHEFNDYWKQIKDALVRIVGHYALIGSSTVTHWETAINKLRTDPLTENDKKNVEELKSWYLDERELKQMVEQLQTFLEREVKERNQVQVQEKETEGREFNVSSVLKIATFGAWLGGNIYVLNRLKDNPDILVDYVKYGIIPAGIAFCCIAFGSIKLSLRAETLDALDELWRRHKTGQLKEDFEKVMITDELKTLANGERIELIVEINEEEFMCARSRIEKLSQLSFCILPPKPSHETIDRMDEVSRILDEMERLRSGQTNEITVIYLSGNPGCGKSEMARQIGETFFTDIPDNTTEVNFVFTLDASSIVTLIHSYMELARILGCVKDDITLVVTAKDISLNKKLVQLKRLVAPKLQMYSSWLMIVDNVTDLELLSRYLPRKGEKCDNNGQVLVATQDSQSFVHDSFTYHVSLSLGMKHVEAVQALNKIFAFPTDDEITLQIAKALDFQPLALACAATFMRDVTSKKSSIIVKSYLKQLKESERKATENVYVKTRLTYPLTTTAAVMIAVEREMSDKVKMHAFHFLSVMAPAPIPLEYVVQFVTRCLPNEAKDFVAENILSSSLILTFAGKSKEIGLHGVVHDCLQTIILNNDREVEFVLLSQVIEAFASLKSYDSDNCNHIFATGSLVVHFMTLAERLKYYIGRCPSALLEKPLRKEYVDTATCLSLIGDVCRTHGEYEASSICFEISLIIQETVNDKNYLPMASTLNSLGKILCELWHYEEAKRRFERALAIQNMAYDKNHPALAITLSNMGNVFGDLGHHEAAKRCLERALDIYEISYNESHPTVAATLSNLGNTLRDLGQYEQAKRCFERVLSIDEIVCDANHPSLATTLNNLGNTLRDLGQYTEAKRCFQRALTIFEIAYGENNPSLAAALNNLGVTLRDLGQNEEAQSVLEKALTIQEMAYGKMHPALSAVLTNLGLHFRDVGKYKNANIHLERALAINETVYDKSHPNLAITLKNLALSFCDLRQYEKAKRFFERALSFDEIA